MDRNQNHASGSHISDSLQNRRSPEIEKSRASHSGKEREPFSIRRTINGVPVSANDFPELCTIGDDALRILLTARQRANGEAACSVPGENQTIH